MLLSPAMSVTALAISMSEWPTYGRVLLEAIVLTMSLGKPIPRFLKAPLSRSVPPVPPSPRTASMRPCSTSSWRTCWSPSLILVMARTRPPAPSTPDWKSPRVMPARSATSLAAMSGVK